MGSFQGPELTTQSSTGSWKSTFEPGAREQKSRAIVKLMAASESDFKRLCDAAAIPEKARIAPQPNY
jgi:hypothetical protein